VNCINLHEEPQQVAPSEFVRDVLRSEVSRLMHVLALFSHLLNLSLMVLIVFQVIK
jgi:hypothetical protein